MSKLSIVFIGILFSGAVSASAYCDGYKEGYKDAYQSERGVLPATPNCPAKPARKAGAPKDEHTRGYLDGARDGTRKAGK